MNGKMILVMIVCMAGIVLLSVMVAVLLGRFLKQRQKKKEEGRRKRPALPEGIRGKGNRCPGRD